MRLKKGYFLVALVCLLCVGSVYAQKKGRPGRSVYTKSERRDRNPVRMPKSKAKILCPIFENNRYPYQGIGLKLGDPFAITYKFYVNEHFAIALDFGKASSGLYSRHFREMFGQYIETDTLSAEASIDYLTHEVKADWVAEMKFLWHFDAKGITPGLRFYVGVGPEVKSTTLEYQYFYNNDQNTGANNLGQFTRKRNTFGPQFTIGIEYSYFQIPISAFMEMELFNDVYLDPGRRRFEGGAGLRYIF